MLFLFVIIVGIIFIGRLLYLQVFNSHAQSIYDDNAIRTVFNYPKRGFVYDRNGKLLVSNQPSYDVMVIPRDVTLDSKCWPRPASSFQIPVLSTTSAFSIP